MRDLDPIETMTRAAQRHPFEDGIAEVMIGVLLATGSLVSSSRWGFLVLAVAAALAWALPRLRDRLAAPRTGSAILPSGNPGKMLLGILVYGILVGALVLAVRMLTADAGAPLGGYRWLPLFIALWLSGGFLHVLRTAGLKRFGLYLAASVGLGLFFTLTMQSGERAAAYDELRKLLWCLAGLLLVSGLLTLGSFIRRNPVFTGNLEGGRTDGR